MAAQLRSRWQWLIPLGIGLGLLYPVLCTDRSYASDWGNHMWLIHMQGLDLSGLGEPGYYLDSTLGFFYPYFAFYGGSMYTVLGVVSQLGSPNLAMVVVIAAAIALNFGGWLWIARLAGLDGWWAMLPGAIAVTTPYAVSNMYARGDIPEMLATSAIPLAAAAGLSCLREPQLRFWTAAAFVGALAVLTGTHTLTLIWGTTFLLMFAVVLAASDWRGARAHLRRGLRLVWLGLLGIALNAWILIPLLLYHQRLREGGPDELSFTNVTEPAQLFSVLRHSASLNPDITADLNTQLPVLALAWALVGGVACWLLLPRSRKLLAAGLAAILGVFLLLILEPSLIDKLPTTWRYIQFPYRLVTYADLAVVGLVTVVLVAMKRAGTFGRVAVWLLAAIAAFGFAQSLAQNSDARSFLPNRSVAVESSFTPPPTWYAPLQFADASAPEVEPTLRRPLIIAPESGDHESYTVSYPPGRAGSAETNVFTWTYLVDVKGADPVGITSEGNMVVRLPASDRPRPVTFSQHWEAPVTVGRWISLLAIVEVLLLSALAAYGFLRRRDPSGEGGAEAPPEPL
ncbi:MAG TPA: hypothetical protein VFI17_08750 [Solirubrobacterales bacterium]|nr:hypothetical protein [Solirubrobacterales bacterium]